MDVRFRPMVQWEGPSTPAAKRRSRWAFKASWPQTLELLERELEHLGAKDIVIEAGLREQDIRQDGWPRSGAPDPQHPGVRIYFESKHGPLVYATDTCEDWRHNVRSIALGLEALRAVDRYGVTRRGEQYTGWKALPAAPAPAAPDDPITAARLVWAMAGCPEGITPQDVLEDAEDRRKVARLAARGTHPDTGGSAGEFQALQNALAVLEAAS